MLRMVEALPLHCVRDMHGVKAESRMFVAACMGRSSRPLMKFVAWMPLKERQKREAVQSKLLGLPSAKQVHATELSFCSDLYLSCKRSGGFDPGWKTLALKLRRRC